MQCNVTVKDIYGEPKWRMPAGYTYVDPFYNFRMVKVGDTFLSPTLEVCTLASGDVVPKGPRIILKKTGPTWFDVYGTDKPSCPKGFEFTGEFRGGVFGEWVLGNMGNFTGISDPVEIRDKSIRRESRLILRKLPVPPARTPKFKIGDKVQHKTLHNELGYGLVSGHNTSRECFYVTWDKKSSKTSELYDITLVPADPTPESVYGGPVKAPAGYRLGVFKKLTTKDGMFLGTGNGRAYKADDSVFRVDTKDHWRYTLIPVVKAELPTIPKNPGMWYQYKGGTMVDLSAPAFEPVPIKPTPIAVSQYRQGFEVKDLGLTKPTQPARWLIEVESKTEPGTGKWADRRVYDYSCGEILDMKAVRRKPDHIA